MEGREDLRTGGITTKHTAPPATLRGSSVTTAGGSMNARRRRGVGTGWARRDGRDGTGTSVQSNMMKRGAVKGGGASAKCLMNFFVPLDTLSWPSLSLWRGDAEGDIAGVLRLRFFRACLRRIRRCRVSISRDGRR
ncbi:hypothetical protein E2C01_024123 [Portunus trituberculatus]|uniref:Uncharacterized protein n=1 Tax=Portunus trituberculatus TaxID=210409 RepID=A0A5B7ED08_PORTR|nr:hypothetical protein [Portunus trituberculatus]